MPPGKVTSLGMVIKARLLFVSAASHLLFLFLGCPFASAGAFAPSGTIGGPHRTRFCNEVTGFDRSLSGNPLLIVSNARGRAYLQD